MGQEQAIRKNLASCLIHVENYIDQSKSGLIDFSMFAMDRYVNNVLTEATGSTIAMGLGDLNFGKWSRCLRDVQNYDAGRMTLQKREPPPHADGWSKEYINVDFFWQQVFTDAAEYGLPQHIFRYRIIRRSEESTISKIVPSLSAETLASPPASAAAQTAPLITVARPPRLSGPACAAPSGSTETTSFCTMQSRPNGGRPNRGYTAAQQGPSRPLPPRFSTERSQSGYSAARQRPSGQPTASFNPVRRPVNTPPTQQPSTLLPLTPPTSNPSQTSLATPRSGLLFNTPGTPLQDCIVKISHTNFRPQAVEIFSIKEIATLDYIQVGAWGIHSRPMEVFDLDKSVWRGQIIQRLNNPSIDTLEIVQWKHPISNRWSRHNVDDDEDFARMFRAMYRYKNEEPAFHFHIGFAGQEASLALGRVSDQLQFGINRPMAGFVPGHVPDQLQLGIKRPGPTLLRM